MIRPIQRPWFPNSVDFSEESNIQFNAWLKREIAGLSVKASNIMRTFVHEEERFLECLLSENLHDEFLKLRSCGRKTALELEPWALRVRANMESPSSEPTKTTPLPPHLRHTANAAVKMLPLLSQRSLSFVKKKLQYPEHAIDELFTKDDLEGRLMRERSIGAVSVKEIKAWVERIKSIDFTEITYRTQGKAVQITRFDRATLAALESRGIAFNCEFMPIADFLNEDEAFTCRVLDLGDLVYGLLQTYLTERQPVQSLEVTKDELFSELSQQVLGSLGRMELFGLWKMLIQQWADGLLREFSNDSSRHGTRSLPTEKRNLLLWWLVEFGGYQLGRAGNLFGVTGERARQIHVKIRETTQWFFENLQHEADQNCYFNRGDGFAVQEFSGEWDITEVNDEWFHSGICTFDGWFNERAWISPGLTHQIEEILMLHYDANGVLDKALASGSLSNYFEENVDIEPLMTISIQKMNELNQTTNHLRHHIQQYLSDVKVAKTLEEIKAGIGATCSLDSIKQEISTLMRTGKVNSLGKRGLYITRIEGFKGSSFQFEHAVSRSLELRSVDYISVGQALADYVELTGVDAEFSSFRTSLLDASNGSYARLQSVNLEPMKFHHIGRIGAESVEHVKQLECNEASITQTLNNLKEAFPAPNTTRFGELCEELMLRTQQPRLALELALAHRHWECACRTKLNSHQ